MDAHGGPEPSPPRVKTDLHVHTVASGHAFSTIREICAQASDAGLQMIGMTDHGPALPTGAHIFHFANLVVLPRVLSGVKVLRSAECNILDVEGALDIPERVLDVLDVVHAGIHPMTGYQGGSVEENTRAVVAAITGGAVDVIVHPGNPLFPLDYETVVEAAVANSVLLEINNSSLTVVRKGSRDNCRIIARIAIAKGARLCVSSDAHDASLVGRFDHALELLDAMGIDEETIANRTADEVLDFLRSRGGKDISFD
jgi:putative hydrolase